MLTAGRYEGRRKELNDRMHYDFGTCSYLGLDIEPNPAGSR